jgi:release factor glutamine methyltransferase
LPNADEHATVARSLAAAGFVAAEEEADELLAHCDGDAPLLDALLARRLSGEPLAWITGRVTFCDIDIGVDPGVYVPRWQSEPMARRAAERLPATGTAVDLCTGSGALAKLLATRRPAARVVATEVDERAVACAAANGVTVFRGDLFAPLPADLVGSLDVVVGVVPYVPTPALAVLPRDTLAFESPRAYDGGPDGTEILRRVLAESPRYLRPGGALLLELGGDQADRLAAAMDRLGFVNVVTLADEDGDIRAVEATLAR